MIYFRSICTDFLQIPNSKPTACGISLAFALGVLTSWSEVRHVKIKSMHGLLRGFERQIDSEAMWDIVLSPVFLEHVVPVFLKHMSLQDGLNPSILRGAWETQAQRRFGTSPCSRNDSFLNSLGIDFSSSWFVWPDLNSPTLQRESDNCSCIQNPMGMLAVEA